MRKWARSIKKKQEQHNQRSKSKTVKVRMLSDIVDPNDSISKYTNNMFFFHFTFSYFIIYAYLKKHGHRLSSHNCNKKYIPKTHTH